MSTDFEFEQSEEMEGTSGFLRKPGAYHLIIAAVDTEPTNKDGKLLDGLKVEGEVLDGTEPSEKGKHFDFMLWKPKATDKNNGEMAKRKLTRLSYALNFIQSHAAGQKVVIKPELCEGQQIVAKFAEKEEDGKKRIELNYSDIFHVDDPAVKDVPKSAQALSAIPEKYRKATPAAPAVSGAAASASVDLSNI